jgi:polysaccharide biosynthesis/export protein
MVGLSTRCIQWSALGLSGIYGGLPWLSLALVLGAGQPLLAQSDPQPVAPSGKPASPQTTAPANSSSGSRSPEVNTIDTTVPVREGKDPGAFVGRPLRSQLTPRPAPLPNRPSTLLRLPPAGTTGLTDRPGFRPGLRQPRSPQPGSPLFPPIDPNSPGGLGLPPGGTAGLNALDESKFGRYRLGAGDAIFINVQRFSDLNFQGVINPEGAVVLPLVGNVLLQGQTLSQAQGTIQRLYSVYFVNPVVSLSLLSQRPVRVTVTGKVLRPGYYPLTTPRVSDAIVVAGGGMISSDFRQVLVRRGLTDGSVIEQMVDLYTPLTQARTAPELRLEDGDVIYVPELRQIDPPNYDLSTLLINNSTLLTQRAVSVAVTGKVSRPGYYQLPTGKVGEALLTAGGSLATADLRAIKVSRTLSDGTVLEESVDLYSSLAGGKGLPNFRLEEGDVVSVPELDPAQAKDYNSRLVASSSLVKQTIAVRMLSYAAGGAGTLTLPTNSTFRDVLNGVPLDQANLASVALIRFDPAKGQTVTQKLDGKRALMGDPSQDVPLQDNDVVVIGRNLVSRITFALNTFTQPFRDVLGFLLFFDSLKTSASTLFQPKRSSGN